MTGPHRRHEDTFTNAPADAAAYERDHGDTSPVDILAPEPHEAAGEITVEYGVGLGWSY